MKTKEYSVWVGYNYGQGIENGALFEKEADVIEHGWDEKIKAKLVIEIPEKKIEVTPSMVKNALRHMDEEKILKELFGEQE